MKLQLYLSQSYNNEMMGMLGQDPEEAESDKDAMKKMILETQVHPSKFFRIKIWPNFWSEGNFWRKACRQIRELYIWVPLLLKSIILRVVISEMVRVQFSLNITERLKKWA